MAGLRALTKLQLGAESVAGTPVAATAIWRGLGVLDDQREVVFPEETVGILGGTDRAYTPKFLAALSMPDVEATFEQIPYLMEAGVELESSTQDGVGSGYIYEYDIPTTTVPTLRTYTIEGGDNEAVEEMEYAFVESFRLSGNAGEPLMVSAEWKGRQCSTAEFTGALSLPAIEEIMVSKGTLFIDDEGGTIGTTQITGSMLGIDFGCNLGLIPWWTCDGEKYFTFTKYNRSAEDISLAITFEHDSNSEAEKAAWRAETARLIRVKFEGNALGTSGTDYIYKSLIIDLAGKWEEFGTLEEQDGNNTINGLFRVKYNATAALKGRLTVVNELSALT